MADDALPPTELHVRDEGSGPVLLLLHGIGADHTLWNDVIPGLSKEFRVLAPDLRGHGRTPAPAGSRFTFAELEGDLESLLDQRSIESAYLVGHSGGAFLALRFVLDRPARARGLVMVSGAAYADRHSQAILQRWAETRRTEGLDAFGLRLLKDLYYPDWIEAHLDFADTVREQLRHTDFGPSERWSAEFQKFDERNRVGSVRTPTLIVQAMDDQVVDASHGRILRQSIPGAQIRILAETGHMVPIERPQETIDALAGFVRAAEEQRALTVRST
ncbi:MAG: alpha/beta fold hydrolase [Thermoplasmata archaeon]